MERKLKRKKSKVDRDKALKEILEKDFDDLTIGELQFLRNRARQTYGLNAHTDGKIGATQLLQVYLNWKRRYIPLEELETLLIEPKNRLSIKSAFSDKTVQYTITINVWDGALSSNPVGKMDVTHPITLYVLTVSYKEDLTEVICLSPQGNFCRITNRQFAFDI